MLGWAGLIAIAASAVAFSDETPYPGYAALLPTMGAALAIWAGIAGANARFSAGRFLTLAPLRLVGDRSYAFYLWHWPVLVIAAQYAEAQLPVGVNLLLLLAAFALSVVSYALVEDPIRRARWGTVRTGGLVTAAVAAVLVSATFSLDVIDRKEARYNRMAGDPVVLVPVADRDPAVPRQRRAPRFRALPAVVAAVNAAKRDEPIPSGLWPPVGDLPDEPRTTSLPRGCVPVAHSSQSTSLLCPVGVTRSRRTLVLIGDSHAQMWLPAVVRLALRDGWRVIPLLRPGCTPDTWTQPRGIAACRPWYRWATAQVAHLRPRVTLVAGAFLATEARAARAGVEAGIEAMVRALRPATRCVVVVGDPEGLERNPVDCLLSRRASMGRCTATWSKARLAPYGRVAKVARAAGAGFLDTRGWFCLAGWCPPVVARTVVYRDPRHVTEAYARRLGGPFRAAFRRSARAG
jgi:hypothetical protein